MVEGRRLRPDSLLLARFIHPVGPEENRKPGAVRSVYESWCFGEPRVLQKPVVCLSENVLEADPFFDQHIPLPASSSHDADHPAPREMKASRCLAVFPTAPVGTGCAPQSPGVAWRG